MHWDEPAVRQSVIKSQTTHRHTSPQNITACACLTLLLHTPSERVEVEAQSLPAVLSCCWEAERSSSLLRLLDAVQSELKAEQQLPLEDLERAELDSCSGPGVSSPAAVVAFYGEGSGRERESRSSAARNAGSAARGAWRADVIYADGSLASALEDCPDCLAASSHSHLVSHNVGGACMLISMRQTGCRAL